MAFQELTTGYKPEFTLGGLYHGFNAANAEDLNKEELIKQFLANQHAQVQNPLDEQTTAQNLLINQHKADPRYGAAQLDIQEGQRDLQTASGALAQFVLPQKKLAEQAQLENQAATEGLFSRMRRGIGQQHDQSLPEPQREAAAQQAYMLADTMSQVDPAIMAKERMFGEKLENNIDVQELRNQKNAAEVTKKISEPKYKEQLAMAFKTVANPNATPQEKYEAEMFIYFDKQNRIAANPGAYNTKVDVGQMGSIPMTQAPVKQQEAQRPQPPSGSAQAPTQAPTTIKYDAQGNRVK